MRYSLSFEPIFLEGYTAQLFGSELPPEGKAVKCIAVDAMPEYQIDFGALSAATWSTDNEDTNLEMQDMEIAQIRLRVQDDIKVKVKNPSSIIKWRSKRTTFHLPQFPVDPAEEFLKEYFWMASELFVWEDNTPRFDVYSQLATSTSRILVSGWKFKVVTMLGDGVVGKIPLWVNSWPPATSK